MIQLFGTPFLPPKENRLQNNIHSNRFEKNPLKGHSAKKNLAWGLFFQKLQFSQTTGGKLVVWGPVLGDSKGSHK